MWYRCMQNVDNTSYLSFLDSEVEGPKVEDKSSLGMIKYRYKIIAVTLLLIHKSKHVYN